MHAQMLSHLTLNLTLFLSFGKFSPTKTHAMLNPFFIIEKLCRITFKKKKRSKSTNQTKPTWESNYSTHILSFVNIIYFQYLFVSRVIRESIINHIYILFSLFVMTQQHGPTHVRNITRPSDVVGAP